MSLISHSKLPDVGTTIFTVMSQLAQQHGAINLSQGYPDFDPPDELLERVAYHFKNGHNQYAPMAGVGALREALATQIFQSYRRKLDPATEISIVPGATEALFCAIQAVVRPGDEVIVFDPAYDSYEPAVTLAGGTAIHLPLKAPDFGVDWQQVRDTLSPRTRLIIINTPHNPTGSVLRQSDLDTLAEILRNSDTLVLSDEVYEHLVFDGQAHASVLSHVELFQRSFAVYSFGKTYHATGWKTGYCIAPAPLMEEFRKVHQFVTFVAVTPIQMGLADYMQQNNTHLDELAGFYQTKRNQFCEGLVDSRFRLTPSCGTYFQLADYSAISDLPDTEFCRQLTIDHGVAAIPLSPFYQQMPEQKLVRFCFAKQANTLEQAINKLCRI